MRTGIAVLALTVGVSLAGCIVVIEKGDGEAEVRTQREVIVDQDVRREVRRTGTEIAYDVRDAILADPELRDADIRISASGGTVRLRGEVASAALRDRAIDLAGGVAGVERVDSRIELTDWN